MCLSRMSDAFNDKEQGIDRGVKMIRRIGRHVGILLDERRLRLAKALSDVEKEGLKLLWSHS